MYIGPTICASHTWGSTQHWAGHWAHEDQHSPQAKADQGISSTGMGSDLAWTAPILTQPLNQNQLLISSLISSYNSVSVEFNSIPLQAMYYRPFRISCWLVAFSETSSNESLTLESKPCRYIITFVAVLLVIGKEHSVLSRVLRQLRIKLLSHSNSELSDSQPWGLSLIASTVAGCRMLACLNIGM